MDRIVKAVPTGTTIRIEDLNANYAHYSGVKLKNDNTAYEVPTDYLTMTYGDNADGTDGGVFIEFTTLVTGSMPKYTSFPLSTNDAEMQAFLLYWFDNHGKQNYVQLVAARAHNDGSLGTSFRFVNISAVTVDANLSNDAVCNNTVVHELGHQFDLIRAPGGHVDDTVSHPNHAYTDDCLMSYNANWFDGISEFCPDCIEAVRNRADGL